MTTNPVLPTSAKAGNVEAADKPRFIIMCNYRKKKKTEKPKAIRIHTILLNLTFRRYAYAYNLYSIFSEHRSNLCKHTDLEPVYSQKNFWMRMMHVYLWVN